ncbi:hypothetical protein AXF42_Ash007332 [Apostasia shenzhenica]|uniref:Protein MIZU-KUSSEI 1 n=1 Tax=Apostasia shenzhenica TaxID=1088818 RepID=A0A2I0B9W3_9ASPA|nr:hypothetical protein AXF42_Ash007332 [Apostasia shenzhenica]
MKQITARTPNESSFSFSRRHFSWIIARVESAAGFKPSAGGAEEEESLAPTTAASVSLAAAAAAAPAHPPARKTASLTATRRAVRRIRSALRLAVSGRNRRPAGLGPRVIGTLFGPRRGHVRIAFQSDPRACPALLVELPTPTSSLVKEMASGLVRIALECEHKTPASAVSADGGGEGGGGKVRLVEERLWRAYCNGRKCGYALRRECGPGDWRVLRAVEPVSMGAGVLPSAAAAEAGGGSEEEMMYMRARFERVVGSGDSEAFYMMSPDGNGGGPELSIYLLRVSQI